MKGSIPWIQELGDQSSQIQQLTGSMCRSDACFSTQKLGVSWIPFLTGNGTLLVGIGLDQTGINSKTFATNQSLVDAALNNTLKDAAEEIALTKSAVTVLRRRALVRHLTVEVQLAEPAKGEVQMNILAQPALGPDAIPVTDDQHADHRLLDPQKADRSGC